MIAVAAASATHLSMSAPTTAIAGTQFDVTVTASDQYGNTATGYAGTIRFVSTDGAAVLPGSTTLVGGTRTLSFVLKTAGTKSITATDTVTGTLTASSGAIALSPAAADHFTVDTAATATAGAPITVIVTADDAYGNIAGAYAGTVQFASNDGRAALPADGTLTAGVGLFSLAFKSSGERFVTVSDTLNGLIRGVSDLVSVTAASGTHFDIAAPASAAVGVPATILVTALDQYGDTADSYTGTVHFTSGDGLALLPDDYTFTAADAGLHAFAVSWGGLGPQSITVDDTRKPSLAGTSGAVLVTPGPITLAGLSLRGVEGIALTDAPLARFTAGDNQLPPAIYSANIDWGDRTQSSGSVLAVAGGYEVLGTHAYDDEGQYAVVVTVGGSAATNQTIAAATITEALPDGAADTPIDRLISEIYHDLLGRAADTAGLFYWNGALNQGTPLADLVTTIENTNEHRSLETEQVFRQYLHREADTGGLDFGVSFLAAGGTVEQLAARVCGSDEYFSDGGGTNDGFLTRLFADALGRSIDAPSLAFFGSRLDGGATRWQIAASVLGSDEYRAGVISGIYRDLLQRAADPPALAHWQLALARGASDEQVIVGIIAEPNQQEYVRHVELEAT
jgi:hypothetical protein